RQHGDLRRLHVPIVAGAGRAGRHDQSRPSNQGSARLDRPRRHAAGERGHLAAPTRDGAGALTDRAIRHGLVDALLAAESWHFETTPLILGFRQRASEPYRVLVLNRLEAIRGAGTASS